MSFTFGTLICVIALLKPKPCSTNQHGWTSGSSYCLGTNFGKHPGMTSKPRIMDNTSRTTIEKRNVHLPQGNREEEQMPSLEDDPPLPHDPLTTRDGVVHWTHPTTNGVIPFIGEGSEKRNHWDNVIWILSSRLLPL